MPDAGCHCRFGAGRRRTNAGMADTVQATPVTAGPVPANQALGRRLFVLYIHTYYY